MFVLEKEDPDLYDRVQEQNLLRQYDLMTNCIEIGLKKGPMSFDKYLLWALNHVAVANILSSAADFAKRRFTLAITSRRISLMCQIGWIAPSQLSKRTGKSGQRQKSPPTDCGA